MTMTIDGESLKMLMDMDMQMKGAICSGFQIQLLRIAAPGPFAFAIDHPVVYHCV